MLERNMTSALTPSQLSNDQLLAETKRLAAQERYATAALIRALIELDTRRLYLSAGYSSLFTYCTQALHLSEGGAYNRIEATRAACRIPQLLDGLEDGSMTLTTIRLLSPHLTEENYAHVLASARHKSKREVEQLVAALAPTPAAPTMIRKLPEARSAGRQPMIAAAETHQHRPSEERAVHQSTPAAVKPLAPERYKIQLTISGDTHEKLRRVQDLLRHTVPDGDPVVIFDRALTVLLEQLEKRRSAETPSPRRTMKSAPNSRHIPAAVRREVWRRDGGRCAFEGTDGRCTERGFLEFHHVEPYALGGPATVENIQLRCRAHNAFEAALLFAADDPILARDAREGWWPEYDRTRSGASVDVYQSRGLDSPVGSIPTAGSNLRLRLPTRRTLSVGELGEGCPTEAHSAKVDAQTSFAHASRSRERR
jgi:hypothetical protein